MGRIDPAQAALWPHLSTGRPPSAQVLAEYGVEVVTSTDRLPELRRRYGAPTAIDVGRSVFGRDCGLLFVDDDSGRAVAYVASEIAGTATKEGTVVCEQDQEELLAHKTAAHTLMPAEVAKQTPPLYANEEQGDEAIAQVKLFTPWSNWTWYVSEYDPAERLCFGIVVGFEREYGYFSLAELEEIRGPGGLRIERDLHWSPKPLKDCG